MHWPVTYAAPGVHSQAMALATSVGVALRPTGTTAPCRASCAVCDPVAIQPGATALAVTPAAPKSTAIERARPTIPALAAA